MIVCLLSRAILLALQY